MVKECMHVGVRQFIPVNIVGQVGDRDQTHQLIDLSGLFQSDWCIKR